MRIKGNNVTAFIDVLNEAEIHCASDVHFTVGREPTLRVKGALMPLGSTKLTAEDTKEICMGLLDDDKKAILERDGQVDLSWSIPEFSRYRVNIYKQRNSYAAALRRINWDIPSFEQMHLPDVLRSLALKPRGIVLITGPTGSGKSTTLATMVDHINEQRSCHIITIEDPIEYLHRHKRSLVNQREVGSDTNSFSNALRAALREDPDVILVGEMRDPETISTAVSAAETGHFVMSTVHTVSAAQTLDRIIDAFPAHQQQQIRTQLASTLQGIICQQLIPTADGLGVVPALEILLVNDAVRNLIREGKQHQINTVIQTNKANGMMMMDYSLAQLVREDQITLSDAKARCVDYKLFMGYLSGGM